jgi:IS605 OrfB family transposase
LADYAVISSEASIYALKGLLKNQNKSKLNTAMQTEFAINKRQANSIIAFVSGEMISAKECQVLHITILSGKIKSLKSIVLALQKKIDNHKAYLKAVVEFQRQNKAGKKAKLSQKYKPQFDSACSVAFGRKTGTYYQSALNQLHQKKRQLHKLEMQLKHLTNGELHVNLGNLETIYFVGSSGESNGNQICQLIVGSEKNTVDILKIRTPLALEKRYGEYVEIPVNLSGYGDEEILAAWAQGQSITYRIRQPKYGVWSADIIVDVYRPITSKSVMLGCLGVDLNIDSVAWCKVNSDGNPKRFGQINFNLHSLSHHKIEAVLVDVVTKLTSLALAFKCPIVIEKLDFQSKKSQLKSGLKHQNYNRILSGFAYRCFYELLSARCFKLGIKLITVNPAYSSVIGMLKFMSPYGMNSGTAAALVIARRAMNYSEGVPTKTAYNENMESKKHVWSAYSTISRKVKGCRRHSFYQPRPTADSSSRNGVEKTHP